MIEEGGALGDLMAFEMEVYNLLQDYCDNHDDYPLNCVLAIDPDFLIVSIDILENVEDCDIYPIGFFLDGDEPDMEEIEELSNKYFDRDY